MPGQAIAGSPGPSGTAETSVPDPSGSTIRSSLQDCGSFFTRFPALQRWAILRSSLWDEVGNGLPGQSLGSFFIDGCCPFYKGHAVPQIK
jgi:hypothetical protein